NVGMFRRAGLVDASGQPILPRTVEELMAQAARIREATGKPYFIMGALAGGDAANATRTFYSLLYQQNGTIFPAGYERADFNTPRTRAAAMAFMRYLWDNNFQWARGGGHLPVRMSLMAQYTQLPQRENVVRITQIGRALPHDVRRQFGFQALIGEELANVING